MSNSNAPQPPAPGTRDQPTKPKFWGVYTRLLGYVLRYRFRLGIMIFFSFAVAVTFSTSILATGTFIKILYDPETEVLTDIEELKGDIRDFTTAAQAYASWIPDDLDQRYETLILQMRADRRYALYVLAAVLVVLVLMSGLSRFLQEYYAGSICAGITTRMNMQMYQNVLMQSHEFFESRPTGEVVARFTNDSFLVNRGLVSIIVKLSREPIKALFLFGLAMTINVQLTLLVIFVMSPIVFVIQTVGKQIRRSVRGSLTKLASMASIIAETMSGITVIKGFRMEGYQLSRMADEVNRLKKFLKRIARADSTIAPATEVLMMFGIVAFVLVSERQIANSTLKPGQLVILFGSLVAMLDPLRKLANVYNLMQTSVASAERVFEYIDLKTNIHERHDAVELQPLKNSLRFEEVHYAYNEHTQALRGINLELKKGDMVALVGFSGSGKSTLAILIPRFRDPTKGRITFDGVDIRDASIASLRDRISIVSQDSVLFRDTIRNNITAGSDEYTHEQVKEAARKAHAAHFIEALPQGYDTLVEESGTNLSAGQQQRLALARAIVKDPDILILDEATSNLDAESEHEIQEALKELVVDRATLVIAHRLSTVRRADRIVVLDAGEIAEEGTHDELIALGGIFARLHRLQFPDAQHQDTGS